MPWGLSLTWWALDWQRRPLKLGKGSDKCDRLPDVLEVGAWGYAGGYYPLQKRMQGSGSEILSTAARKGTAHESLVMDRIAFSVNLLRGCYGNLLF